MINTNSGFLGWWQYSVAYNMAFTYTKKGHTFSSVTYHRWLRHELHKYVKPLYSTVLSSGP